EIPRGRYAQATHVLMAQRDENFVEDAQHACTCFPLRLTAQQVFFRNHFKNWPDVLRHAPVYEHQTFLQLASHFGWGLGWAEQPMWRQEPASRNPDLRVPFTRGYAFDQFHGRPPAPRVLPPAAGTAEPFAEQRASEHQASFRLLQRSGERGGLAGGSHAH